MLITGESHFLTMRQSITMDDNRYEKKGVIQNCSRHDAILEKCLIDLGFAPHYNLRKINNLYFDDDRFSLFRNHQDGLLLRYKVRARWYGDLIQSSIEPYLELKVKRGEFGRKHKIPIGVLDSKDIWSVRPLSLMSCICNEINYLGNWSALNLMPKLLNSYERCYFVKGAVRITIDRQLKFGSGSSFSLHADTQKNIIEFKYPRGQERVVRETVNALGLQCSKFSKYITGACLVYGLIT